MNKKIRNLIIGGVVLVLLIGVLLLLKFLPQGGTEDESSSSSESSYVSTAVQLFSKDKDEIASIQVENETNGYTILRQAEGVYTIEDLEGFDQLTDKYSSIVSTYANVSATRLVEENPSDLSKYGLKSPSTTVTVTYKDGSKNVIYAGDALPTGDGRYVLVNDDPSVYSLGPTTSSPMDYTELSFVNTTVIEAWTAPADEDGSSSSRTEPDIKRLNIVGGSLTEKLGKTPLTIVMSDYNEDMEGYGLSGSTWKIISPVNASLHNENTSALRDAVTNGVTATSVAAINPTAEQLTEFGFDEPYAKVEFTRDNDDFALTVGSAADGSSHYVMLDGRNVVYVVSDDSIPWISVDINKVFSSLMVLPYIDKIAEVEVTINGKTYLFEEEGEEDDLTATVNGQDITLDNYRKMYQFFLSAPAEELNYTQETGPEIARITYRYRDTDKEDIIRFLKVSDRRCVLSVNGDESFLTRTVYLDRLQSNLDLILQDQTPDLDY